MTLERIESKLDTLIATLSSQAEGCHSVKVLFFSGNSSGSLIVVCTCHSTASLGSITEK